MRLVRSRRLLRLLQSVAASMALLAALPAAAQSTVKLVVPYPPGGSMDTLARYLQPALQDLLKTTVIVDNRPGAGGRIALSQLKREPADGSVVVIAPNGLTTIQSLVYAGHLDYDMQQDFTAVSKLAAFPMSLAVPAVSGVKTLAQLKASYSAKPGTANFGTSSAGGIAHFSGLVLGKAAGIAWSHVGYKGGAPLVNDMMGNHISAGIDTIVDQIEYHRAGKITIVGIFSPTRYALAPDIPTMAEQGVQGLPPIEGWFGTFVSARTPKAVVERLDQALGVALADPELKAKLNRMMVDVSYLPSAEFSALQARELQQWAPIIRDSGFKPE